MLKKDICKKCRYKHYEDKLDEVSMIIKNRNVMWNNLDEKRWEEGRLWCMEQNTEAGVEPDISINKAPPEHCKYLLEHLV
jgi:hypothetical protein